MERNKLEELERNKRRQRELEDELRMLKARENQLRDEVAEGKELQQKVDEVGRGRRVGCTVSRTWVGTMGVGCGVLRDICNCAQPVHSNIHTMLSF